VEDLAASFFRVKCVAPGCGCRYKSRNERRPSLRKSDVLLLDLTVPHTGAVQGLPFLFHFFLLYTSSFMGRLHLLS